MGYLYPNRYNLATRKMRTRQGALPLGHFFVMHPSVNLDSPGEAFLAPGLRCSSAWSQIHFRDRRFTAPDIRSRLYEAEEGVAEGVRHRDLPTAVDERRQLGDGRPVCAVGKSRRAFQRK